MPYYFLLNQYGSSRGMLYIMTGYSVVAERGEVILLPRFRRRGLGSGGCRSLFWRGLLLPGGILPHCRRGLRRRGLRLWRGGGHSRPSWRAADGGSCSGSVRSARERRRLCSRPLLLSRL